MEPLRNRPGDSVQRPCAILTCAQLTGRRPRMTTPAAPRAWPGATLARVPYWVYQDEANYRDELRRLFEGPAWNYLGLQSHVPRPAHSPTTSLPPMPAIAL